VGTLAVRRFITYENTRVKDAAMITCRIDYIIRGEACEIPFLDRRGEGDLLPAYPCGTNPFKTPP
jgi:hypothetical protein